MKKYLSSMLLSAAAIISATMSVSCGEEDDDNGLTPEQPVEKVVMGKYSLEFSSVKVSYWPDANTGIEAGYEAYQKSITDALKVDLNKKYNWSDIEADEARLKKVFGQIGDFEYKVKCLRNYLYYYGGETSFGALKDGSSYLDMEIGEKNVKCIKDIPDDATCQLYIEMSSFEPTLTSAKEYCDKVRALYTEALKEEFTGEYGSEVKGVSHKENFYYNMANYKTDSLEVRTRVNQICEAVEVPELPDDLKKEAQALSPALPYLFKIWVNKYDPKTNYPTKSEVEVFSYSVKY